MSKRSTVSLSFDYLSHVMVTSLTMRTIERHVQNSVLFHSSSKKMFWKYLDIIQQKSFKVIPRTACRLFIPPATVLFFLGQEPFCYMSTLLCHYELRGKGGVFWVCLCDAVFDKDSLSISIYLLSSLSSFYLSFYNWLIVYPKFRSEQKPCGGK